MLKRFRPYLRYIHPVRWHFFGALVAGLIFGVATGAGLPLLTKSILPRLLGGGKDLVTRTLEPDQSVTVRLAAENAAGGDGAPGSVEVRVGEGEPDRVPLAPGEGGGVDVTLSPALGENTTGRVEVEMSEKPGENVPLGELILLASIMPAAFLLRGVAGFINSYGMAYCGQRILEALRLDVFAHLQSLSLRFFEQRQSGDLLSRLVADTTSVRSGIINISNDLIKQPITLAGAIVAIIILSFQNSEFFFLLVFMLSVPLCIWPIHAIATKLKKRARQLQKMVGGVSAYVTESLQAPREIRAFNLQDQQVKGLGKRITKLLRLQMKVVKYSKLVAPSIELVAAFGISATVIYAGHSGLGLEEMLPLLLALYVCYEPIKRLGGLQTRIKRMEASLERIEELLHEKPEVMDPEDPVELGQVSGRVAFRDVSFAYGVEPVLQDVDLEMAPGEVVGIVGPSGAGKSTFINLLLRFYDVSSGSVTIDGHDLRSVRKRDLREAIGFVPQDPLLFNVSARENILVGRPGASDEEVVEAARQAQAHEFIEAMENGYETVLGEKGTRLSGGQRQRIALARAFLRNAPILVLDEASSALDSENEALVQTALEKLMVGKTVFIIAHRFSTLGIVNRILVLHQGRVVGDGTHEELQGSCPLYRDLRELQIFDA